TKGYARLPRFYAPQEIELFFNDGSKKTLSVPYAGNGFEEQIDHFCKCIKKGLTQSPVNTAEQTLYITAQMDSIRKMVGIVYPQDEK
ncbi:MAG: hypothetical protein IIW48_03670, partial [Clostridia bacterium]|nr:hypothetical protein [Clostridia bacterium]